MACGQSVTKNLKKRSIKVIPKDDHEDGPEGEAWKKPLSGPSDYDAVVREATTGVFFVFSWQESNPFCAKRKIVRLKAIFHLAQIGKRTSEYQSEDLLHGLFTGFSAHGEFISSYSSDKGTATSCTRKVPTGLLGTAHHAAGAHRRTPPK